MKLFGILILVLAACMFAPSYVSAQETTCSDTVDNDEDGFVNDGCPAVGEPEGTTEPTDEPTPTDDPVLVTDTAAPSDTAAPTDTPTDAATDTAAPSDAPTVTTSDLPDTGGAPGDDSNIGMWLIALGIGAMAAVIGAARFATRKQDC